ncbi:hypothetical protein ACH5RR_038747 [Cinchona calisaya]|uniref:Uncharacterized protein n=1 Tax=Cinchona calisaya TaxID=153742 RepID=A0ABD2Y1S3_9GENT
MQTELYIKEWIGLKSLDDAGRVKYITVPGNHLGISKPDMKKSGRQRHKAEAQEYNATAGDLSLCCTYIVRMSAQAEATNYYYFHHLGRNSSVLFNYTTMNNTVTHYDIPQPQDTLSRSQAIFVLIVTVLLNFLQLKYQGKDQSPFETHPKIALLAVVSLILYCILCNAKLRISGNHPNYIHCLVKNSMVFFGFLSLASLSSVLFPEPFCPFLFSLSILFSLLSILFSLCQLLQSHIRKSWEWLKGIIMDRFCNQVPQDHGRRGLVSVQLPWFNQMAIRGEVDTHVRPPV